MYPALVSSFLALFLLKTFFFPSELYKLLTSSSLFFSCSDATLFLEFSLTSLYLFLPFTDLVLCHIWQHSLLLNGFNYFFVSSSCLMMSRSSFCPPTHLLSCFQPYFFHCLSFSLHIFSFKISFLPLDTAIACANTSLFVFSFNFYSFSLATKLFLFIFDTPSILISHTTNRYCCTHSSLAITFPFLRHFCHIYLTTANIEVGRFGHQKYRSL